MREVIYVKFANERDEKFSVRTEIVECDGERFVVKMPMTAEAAAHVKGMSRAYRELSAVYHEAGYEMCPCEEQAQGLCFAYINGESLEDRWDNSLAEGDTLLVEKEMLQFAKEIRSMFGNAEFSVTDQFSRVFGTVDLPQKLPGAEISNIDMLAGNIILNPAGKYVIDYEWVFYFPVPVDFIIYRMVQYYIDANEARKELRNKKLYERCGIDEELIGAFAVMERNFQSYIEGNRVPLRKMYPMISPGAFHVAPWIEAETCRKRNSKLQVFFSFGEGYIEKESKYYEMSGGRIRLELDIPEGTTNVRLDPGAEGTLCEVIRLCYDISEKQIEAYNTVGLCLSDRFVIFPEADPQITLDTIPDGASRIMLEMQIMPLEERILKLWHDSVSVLNERRIRELEEKNVLLERWKSVAEEMSEGNTLLRQKINYMELTKAWRLYMKYCKIRGRGQQMKIYASIDGDKIGQDNKYLISGWAAIASDEEVELTVSVDGEGYARCKIEREERSDVKKAVGDLANCTREMGFCIVIDGLEELCENYDKIDITAKTKLCEQIIYTKELKELKKTLEEGELNYHIDVLEKRSDHVIIQGWALGKDGKYEICVLDGAGNAVDADIRRIKRPDVLKAYGIEPEYNCGFEIRFPRKGVTGAAFTVRFFAGSSNWDHVVDLKKFDRNNTGFGRVMNLLALSNFKNNCRFIKENGFASFIRLIQREKEAAQNEYDVWRKNHALTKRQIRKQKERVFGYAPQISIAVPLYNTPLEYLKELLDSVEEQTYANWELCLADGSTDDGVGNYIAENYKDQRIKYKKLQQNKGIAENTNEALQMAAGEYVMLADHDDVLAVNALYEMVAVLNEDADIDIIYTDEDLTDATGTEYSSPRFKPDFNLDFLRCINYICHIFMVRKTILDKVGMFRAGYDGAQDYDLILRCCEVTNRIHHIPMILYHWRAHESSTAGNPESKMYAVEAGKKALEDHYMRMKIDAKVEYTGIFILFKSIIKVADTPKVSILIPNKDHIEDLQKCIVSIEEKTAYKNYEIIVIENNSEEERTFTYYDTLENEYENVRVVNWTDEFNYSRINNYGAELAEGEYFVFLNNDTEVISETWMEEMLGYCQREDVGAVGAKLYYADDTVQHAGIVIGVGGFAGHILTGSSRSEDGYFGRLKAIQDVSAVTAACMMVKRSVFESVGGFDEEFVVALNDVDLCMKIRKSGKLIIFNPWVELYHYESKSRGYEDTPEKLRRFKGEIKRFRDKWHLELEQGDPYYNRNLTLDRGDCSIRRKDEHFEIIEDL